MEIVIDPDVKSVVEFMQERMAASRLVAVASGIAAIAPLLWGRHTAEPVNALRLMCDPPIDHYERTPPGAI